MTARRLFLQWALINALFVVFLVAGASTAKLHGATLVAVPIILLLYVCASAWGGCLSWRADEAWNLTSDWKRRAILHDAEWLNRGAYALQIAGIMSTMIGFYLILQTSDAGDLSAKLSGGSVALLGSFVGVLCSLLILLQQWLLEHALGKK